MGLPNVHALSLRQSGLTVIFLLSGSSYDRALVHASQCPADMPKVDNHYDPLGPLCPAH